MTGCFPLPNFLRNDGEAIHRTVGKTRRAARQVRTGLPNLSCTGCRRVAELRPRRPHRAAIGGERHRAAAVAVHPLLCEGGVVAHLGQEGPNYRVKPIHVFENRAFVVRRRAKSDNMVANLLV